jgi:hypothetical protein
MPTAEDDRMSRATSAQTGLSRRDLPTLTGERRVAIEPSSVAVWIRRRP